MPTLFVLMIFATLLLALMMLGSLLVAVIMSPNYSLVWGALRHRARRAWWGILDRLQDLTHPRYTIRVYIEGRRESSDGGSAYFLLSPIRVYRGRGPFNDVVSEIFASAFTIYSATGIRVRLEVE